MNTGWEIVIAGRNFDPAEFFKSSRIQPCKIWDREVIDYVMPEDYVGLSEIMEGKKPEVRERYWQKVVEFTDFHEGPYPLDMATEAFDYLDAHRDEFKELCSWPGVEERYLNFFDTFEAPGESFEFDHASMTSLAELKISMTINFSLPNSLDAKPPK